MAETTENSVGVPTGPNTTSSPTIRPTSEFASFQQDLGESYDTPTVFIAISRKLNSSSIPRCYAWHGSSMRSSSDNRLEEYTATCAKEAHKVITDANHYRDCHKRAKRKSRRLFENGSSILQDVQDKLNDIPITSANQGFGAMAVDDKTFSEDWGKLCHPSSSSSVKGLDNSNSESPTLGLIALSVANHPVVNVNRKSSCSKWLSALIPSNQSREASESENSFTGFRIYPNPRAGSSREDARTHLHYIASRLMDKCQSHAFPSKATMTELLGKYPGCEVVQISEESADLPILEKVKYIKESENWPSTRDLLRTERNTIRDQEVFELE